MSGLARRDETWWRDDCCCPVVSRAGDSCVGSTPTSGPRLCEHCEGHADRLDGLIAKVEALDSLTQTDADGDERETDFIRRAAVLAILRGES